MSGEISSGLSVIAACVAGSNLLGINNAQIAIGVGSQSITSGNIALANEFDRNMVDTIDLTVPEQVILIANWSPTEVSGLTLTEFGLTTTGSIFVTTNAITGSLVFDGEQELQVQQTLKFYI